MGPKRTVILKPDDPVWAELIADIKAVASGRYAEEPDEIFGPTYAPSVEEPGFEFRVLNREDRQDVLADMVDWRQYECRGISFAQQRIVIANVLDEKPQDKWPEGVFDEAFLENQKIASFKAMVGDLKNSPENHVFKEWDGERRPWDGLSNVAKLKYIARDAVYCDVPFEPFSQVAKDTIGDLDEWTLRAVFDSEKELHAMANYPQQHIPIPPLLYDLPLRDAADFWWCQGLTPPCVAKDNGSLSDQLFGATQREHGSQPEQQPQPEQVHKRHHKR
jgi:hypothetical protein